MSWGNNCATRGLTNKDGKGLCPVYDARFVGVSECWSAVPHYPLPPQPIALATAAAAAVDGRGETVVMISSPPPCIPVCIRDLVP